MSPSLSEAFLVLFHLRRCFRRSIDMVISSPAGSADTILFVLFRRNRPLTWIALLLGVVLLIGAIVVAARFKVLSDPMRLRMLQELEQGERSVTALTEAVESTQPNVSKHLKMLQEAGLVARRQEGNTVYYSIADATVFDLCDVVCGSLQERFAAHASVFAGR